MLTLGWWASKMARMKVLGVVFDLDGTLTRPCLDFDAIRAEIGGVSGPLLEAMLQMAPADQARAEEVLHRHEEVAAAHSELNPGALELLTRLRREGRSVGLVTRNRRASVEQFCKIHGLEFDGVVTREDGPAKPDPFGVARACDMMGVAPSEAVMVGDYVFDLISGRRAGAISVLLTTQKNHHEYVSEADYVIGGLDELGGVIENIENHR